MGNVFIRQKSAVYHYTALTNLKDILTIDGVKLWATRYGFFNDKQEFVWAQNKILPELEKIAQHNTETFDPEHFVHPYIVSFTKSEDDLNMWRLYANDGKGVSLLFDQDEMQVCAENLMGIMNVVYANEHSLRQKIEAAHNEYTEKYANERLADDYREVPAFIKHESYESEQEIRLVKFACDGFAFDGKSGRITDYDEEATNVKFRTRDDILIPYMEIMLPKTSLKEIIIGYNCDYESAKKSIELLLQQRSYQITIKQSSIK